MPSKMIEFNIQGGKELERKLRLLGPLALKVAGRSLYESAEEVMADSKENYVPVDTGNLRSTGVVDLPVTRGHEVEVQLGYGGPAANYAIYVHEMNKAYRNGKQWKYLQQPLEQRLPKIGEKLKDDLDQAFDTL